MTRSNMIEVNLDYIHGSSMLSRAPGGGQSNGLCNILEKQMTVIGGTKPGGLIGNAV